MTKREIASLAIKLMGVFILLKSIAYVPQVLGMMFSVMRTEELLFAISIVMISITMAVIPLAWSLLVIIFSDKAAAWLIKEDNSIENTSSSISKDDVMVVAISCIGLYFIVAAAPVFIHALMNISIFHRQAGSPFVGPSSIFNVGKQLIAPGVQVAIGLCLFAGSKGIVKLWKKIRS
jgi:hypothetical protein